MNMAIEEVWGFCGSILQHPCPFSEFSLSFIKTKRIKKVSIVGKHAVKGKDVRIWDSKTSKVNASSAYTLNTVSAMTDRSIICSLKEQNES